MLSRRRAYADDWRRMLQEARAAGEIHPDRDLALARMFLFGALNWSVEWYDPEKGSLEDFVREAAETFLHGILAPPREQAAGHIVRPANGPRPSAPHQGPADRPPPVPRCRSPVPGSCGRACAPARAVRLC